MATLLSSPSLQVTFYFVRKVICETMQPHGDAAQLAANAGMYWHLREFLKPFEKVMLHMICVCCFGACVDACLCVRISLCV
jgi:hypothetical protein